MASKIKSGQTEPVELNPKKKIPPIQSKRQSNSLKLSDSLVAPVEKQPVPDHLLNTSNQIKICFIFYMIFLEIYAKLQRNDVFEVSPVEVHFSGFEINNEEQKRYTQILKVINISGQVQRMIVIPPQTKFFTIHYVKQVGQIFNLM